MMSKYYHRLVNLHMAVLIFCTHRGCSSKSRSYRLWKSSNASSEGNVTRWSVTLPPNSWMRVFQRGQLAHRSSQLKRTSSNDVSGADAKILDRRWCPKIRCVRSTFSVFFSVMVRRSVKLFGTAMSVVLAPTPTMESRWDSVAGFGSHMGGVGRGVIGVDGGRSCEHLRMMVTNARSLARSICSWMGLVCEFAGTVLPRRSSHSVIAVWMKSMLSDRAIRVSALSGFFLWIWRRTWCEIGLYSVAHLGTFPRRTDMGFLSVSKCVWWA